jgi:hypothetical protein
LNNNTAGVREREDANRTREAGHLDEIQGVVANTLKLFRNEPSLLAKTFGVGFIDWLDLELTNTTNACTVRRDNSVRLRQQTKPTACRLDVGG